MELVETYFAPSLRPQQGAVLPLLDATGIGLTWEEQEILPTGLVARVQRSHDLLQWRESGQSADGLTHAITIEAAGPRRTDRVQISGVTENERPPSLLLRVVISSGAIPNLPQP